MKEKIKILNPQDCVSLLCKYCRMKQEHFGVVFLNSQREVIQTKCFFVGSDDFYYVHPKIIWWKACKLNASAIILFHNHPSGNTDPSEYDIKMTKDFEMGGKLLGIQVLDHIIVGKYDYSSFLEHNLMSHKVREEISAEHK